MDTGELYSLVRSASGISIDTRSLKKGEIFFALKGPNFDGNRYAKAALEAGAVAAVTDDPSLKNDRIIVVSDVMASLTGLASLHRSRLNVPVIAITGTNGKTTTKELVTAVLSRKGRVHATKGNLNNHIGVPVTLLTSPDDAKYLVIEMGANHKGEIASLCAVAQPTHGIITNIGKAHLEGFGSFEDVIAAKSELYKWLLKTGGIAIFNEKNHILKDLIYHYVHKAVPYSNPDGSEMVIDHVPGDDMLLNVSADFEGRHYAFSTSLFGDYNLDNIRAAMAAGVFFEVPFKEIISAVSSYKPSNNRSQVLSTGHNTLICDSYNANPSSMSLALTSFAELRAEKKMVILGDMLELGADSQSEHLGVIEFLDKLDGIEVHLVGPLFRSVIGGRKMSSYLTSEEARESLAKKAPRNQTILVKGSRGMTLEKIYGVL